MFRAALVAAVFAASLAAPAIAGTTIPSDLSLALVEDSFDTPVAVRHSPDGSDRLFVLEKNGLIRIVKKGVLLGTPFLNVGTLSANNCEGGLLGLAFHPEYASNGLFYIVYTDNNEDQVIARYQVSAGNPDVADPDSGEVIFYVNDLACNHNGGDLHFGPDGYLYYSSGDGGPQGDPHGFAQCLGRKNADSEPANCNVVNGGMQVYALLGKIIRIDVDATTANPGSEMCGVPAGANPAQYAIPAGNPYAATANACDEIWHFGFRNPWRFSFDRDTGDMFIGDVGQNTWEEIDFAPAGVGGLNMGWRCWEGAHAYNPALGEVPCSNDSGNPLAGTVLPVIEYSHSVGNSITGGFRYRGTIPEFRGVYAFSDYGAGDIYFGIEGGGGSWSRQTWPQQTPSFIPVGSFGEDFLGELYALSLGGALYKFSSATDDRIFYDGTNTN